MRYLDTFDDIELVDFNKPTKIANKLGNTYGRLKVVDIVGKRKHHNRTDVYWKCLCTCGTTCVVNKRYFLDSKDCKCQNCDNHNNIKFYLLTPKTVLVLTDKIHFVIDKSRLHLVRGKRLYLNNLGYIVVSDPKEGMKYLHRLVYGKINKGFMVDHVSRNKLDNRRSNLRKATKSQNAINRTKDKGSYTSKYKGVYGNPNRTKNKWEASVVHKGKRYYLGSFSTEDEAGRAYNEKAKELFGEFAYLNKIEGGDN